MVQTVADIANKLRRAENRYRIAQAKHLGVGTVGDTAVYYFADGRRDGIKETAKAILYIAVSLRPCTRRVLWSAFRKSWHATKAAITAPTPAPGGAE